LAKKLDIQAAALYALASAVQNNRKLQIAARAIIKKLNEFLLNPRMDEETITLKTAAAIAFAAVIQGCEENRNVAKRFNNRLYDNIRDMVFSSVESLQAGGAAALRGMAYDHSKWAKNIYADGMMKRMIDLGVPEAPLMKAQFIGLFAELASLYGPCKAMITDYVDLDKFIDLDNTGAQLESVQFIIAMCKGSTDADILARNAFRNKKIYKKLEKIARTQEQGTVEEQLAADSSARLAVLAIKGRYNLDAYSDAKNAAMALTKIKPV